LIAKIALFCDVEPEGVFPVVTAPNLYEVPLILERQELGSYLAKKLHLKLRRKPNWKPWQAMVDAERADRPKVRIALVGKYVELQDAYMSVREAVRHAALAEGVKAEILWVQSGDLEKGSAWGDLQNTHGVIVPGGFGDRGIEGMIEAAGFARREKIPYLGLCLGMQVLVIEFARKVLNLEAANSTEFDPDTPHPVIDLMPEQRQIGDLGGTMRLGLYPCEITPGTRTARAYKRERVDERHRHRYEFNNAYRQAFEEQGMHFSGQSPDGRLVEIVELADHGFMLGSQFHPEFLSRPNHPHPLFVAFLKAVHRRAKSLGSKASASVASAS
jgi:CTP synthase